MGYSTDFIGSFKVSPTLSKEHREYLKVFAETRRMKRDEKEASKLEDPIRESVNLPIGNEGEFFVGGLGYMGQDADKSVIDQNYPPRTQPSLWCQWVPNEEGTEMEWDNGEKFYNYVEWLDYLIKSFLERWGYKLNGIVSWEGEEREDVGEINVVDNEIIIK